MLWGAPTLVVAAAAPALAASAQAITYCTTSTLDDFDLTLGASEAADYWDGWVRSGTPGYLSLNILTPYYSQVGHVLPSTIDSDGNETGVDDSQAGALAIDSGGNVAFTESATVSTALTFGSADTLLAGATITVTLPATLKLLPQNGNTLDPSTPGPFSPIRLTPAASSRPPTTTPCQLSPRP